jgi:hypothetical protein
MYSTNQVQDTTNSSFRNRFHGTPSYWQSSGSRRFAADTKLKFNSYEQHGKAIFAVTLSTYLSSEKIARSDWMRKFWERDFLYRMTEHLPYALKNKLDYDYVIERSDEGHWHYHGVLAMPKDAADRIWKDGALKPQLDRDLRGLRQKGDHRKFAVNSFVIEPIREGLTVEDWISYMTKTRDFISSAEW